MVDTVSVSVSILFLDYDNASDGFQEATAPRCDKKFTVNVVIATDAIIHQTLVGKLVTLVPSQ